MVQEFHRLGVLLGAGVQVYWLTLSLVAIACLATSQAASDSKICPVEIGVGTPGISIIKMWAISIV
jgi:anaerobic C4-dicarboxylate transporter